MLYESKVSFTKIVKGNDKVMKEKYMVAEAESFGDAETQTYEFCDGETDLDVIDVKRSKVREIINTRTDENDVIFVADIADTQINEEGEEVELIYKVALNEGLRFAIREGGRTVGSGQITAILDDIK